MILQGRVLCIIILSGILSGCLSNLWTGANLVYDRHDVYEKLHDYNLLAETNNALYGDKVLKCGSCVLDVATFNGDILVAGHLPNPEQIKLARHRLSKIKGYRHLYMEIQINQESSNNLQDSWITTKIRSQIFTDSSIDPNSFKIVTSDAVVYLMGDVKKDEADKVLYIARSTAGVIKVVKLLNYFTYETEKNMARS